MKKQTEEKRLSRCQFYQSKLDKKYGKNRYLILKDTFSYARNKCSIKCLTHNSIKDDVVLDAVLVKTYRWLCPTCKKEANTDCKTFRECRNKFTRLDWSEFVYETINTESWVTCKDCGLRRKVALSEIRYNTYHCQCSNFKEVWDTPTFIKKAERIHGTEKYDFSKSKYKGVSEPLEVICKVCGETLWITPSSLYSTKRCKECGKKQALHKFWEGYRKELEGIRPLLDFSESIYEGMRKSIKVICKKCGRVHHPIASSLRNMDAYSCYWCELGHVRTTRDFIEKSKKVHGDNFSYEYTEYKHNKTKVGVYCKRCNELQWVYPSGHLSGADCNNCATISRAEKTLEDFLTTNNIEHHSQYTFSDCTYINVLRFDSCILNGDKVKLLIEVDGEQHFYPVCFGGISSEEAEENFRLTKLRDEIKDNYCKEKDIPLLRIPYWEFSNIEEILKDYLRTKKSNFLV